MDFSVWEDSPPQWIKSESKGSGSCTDNAPEDKLNGVEISRASADDISKMNEIDKGTKLGSYVYTEYYDIKRYEHTKTRGCNW